MSTSPLEPRPSPQKKPSASPQSLRDFVRDTITDAIERLEDSFDVLGEEDEADVAFDDVYDNLVAARDELETAITKMEAADEAEKEVEEIAAPSETQSVEDSTTGIAGNKPLPEVRL